jgi:hypothetical protein
MAGGRRGDRRGRTSGGWRGQAATADSGRASDEIEREREREKEREQRRRRGFKYSTFSGRVRGSPKITLFLAVVSGGR